MSNSPYLVGSNHAASGGSTTLAVSVATSVASNDSILVGVLVSIAAVTPTVGPDTAGNVYTLVKSDTTETAAQLFLFESDGANPLASGVDSIPVVYSANTSVQGAIVVGDNNVSTADKIVIAHGSSTAPSSGSSGTLSQAEEHAIAFICDAAAGNAPTWATPWSSNVLANIEGGTTTRLSAAFTTVTATTALTASGTITSAVWAAALATTLVDAVSVGFVCSDGVQGEAYSQTLEDATGGSGSYTWSVTGTLPTGLSLSGAVISGTPTVPGVYTFTVNATDAHSMVGSATQTVIILASGAITAASTPLAGNLLARDDSDFSAATAGTWAALTNASSVAYTTHAAVTGAGSLKWTATADGETEVNTGFYLVRPNKPYIVSGYLMPCGQRDCQIGVAWYTSGNTLIRTDIGADNPSDSIAWQPVNAPVTSPSNAAKCKIVALVQEANKGDVTHLDLVYLAQANAQVLIDWENGTASSTSVAGSDFMDVSPWLRMDQGITLMRGRQDGISEIQAGSGSFSLQNDNGFFTRFKSTSLVSVLNGDATLQRRCQVNLADENGVWYTRCDGPLSQLSYTFDNTGKTNILQVSTTDVLAPLNREESLSCWTREQVLNNGPMLHWALNDTGSTGGTGVGAETSGNNGPSMRVRDTDTTANATITWNDSTGGVETLADAVGASSASDGSTFWAPGTNQPNSLIRGLAGGRAGPISTPLPNVTFKPTLVTETLADQFVGNTGFSLRATLPEDMIITPTADGLDYSFEGYFTVDPYVAAHNSASFNYGPYAILTLWDSATGACVICSVQNTNSSDHLAFFVELFNQPPSFSVANFSANTAPGHTAFLEGSIAPPDTVNPIPHHLVLQIQGDPSAPAVTGWLDGQPIGSGSFALETGQIFDTICLAGEAVGYGTHYGSLSCFQVYDYLLTLDQITQDCRLGQYGMWEATTDDCVARLAKFANIPPFWNNAQESHNGLSLTEYFDVTGSNPLSAMQIYEQAEQGLLFVDASGLLQFHTRDWRMGYGAPDLLLPPDTFDADMGYEVIDQFMVNEQGVASAVFTTGTGYTNQESKDEYGSYATSTATSPVQLPLISWSRAYAQLGVSAFEFSATPNMTDFAAFAANARSDPWLLPGQLTVDLQTLSKASTGIGISDLYALEIDNMISPSGSLPASFPDQNASYEWFVEGISETITNKSRTIQFYTSPAEAQRCWVPGDTTYGVLGETSRLGVSAADTGTPIADGKSVAHDGGYPYSLPVFGSGKLNNPSGNGHQFIGANDIRGLTDNMRKIVHPPMWCVAVTTNQIVTSGARTSPQVFWDTLYVDTEGGMGLIPGWPNWYVVTVPGYYDLDAFCAWHAMGVAATVCQGYYLIAQRGAQKLAAGSGTPVTNGAYVCPVGSQNPTINGSTSFEGNNLSTRLYLGVGDMIALAAEQSTGVSQQLSTAFGGSMFSGIYRGTSVSDDQVQISSTVTGGTVSTGGGKGGTTGGTPPSGQTGSGGSTVVTTTKTYHNTHTYSYYGDQLGYQRKDSDGLCYQGDPQAGIGSEASQVIWPASTIAADLTGATVKSVTLTAHNEHTWYGSGGVLMLGWAASGSGGSTFNPSNGGGHRGVSQIAWAEGATKTVNLDASWATRFRDNGQTYFVLGSPGDTSLEHYGYWQGGPSSWTLTITYTKAA